MKISSPASLLQLAGIINKRQMKMVLGCTFGSLVDTGYFTRMMPEKYFPLFNFCYL
jgi:hypothetical protein